MPDILNRYLNVGKLETCFGFLFENHAKNAGPKKKPQIGIGKTSWSATVLVSVTCDLALALEVSQSVTLN